MFKDFHFRIQVQKAPVFWYLPVLICLKLNYLKQKDTIFQAALPFLLMSSQRAPAHAANKYMIMS